MYLCTYVKVIMVSYDHKQAFNLVNDNHWKGIQHQSSVIAKYKLIIYHIFVFLFQKQVLHDIQMKYMPLFLMLSCYFRLWNNSNCKNYFSISFTDYTVKYIKYHVNKLNNTGISCLQIPNIIIKYIEVRKIIV